MYIYTILCVCSQATLKKEREEYDTELQRLTTEHAAEREVCSCFSHSVILPCSHPLILSYSHVLILSFCYTLIPSMQSLEGELSGLRSEVEGGRERVKELEIMVEDKEEVST